MAKVPAVHREARFFRIRVAVSTEKSVLLDTPTSRKQVVGGFIEIRDRDLFAPPDKKTRKQRQKEEQAELSLPRNINQTKTFDEIEEEEKTIPVTQEVPRVEVLDYEDLLDDYGF